MNDQIIVTGRQRRNMSRDAKRKMIVILDRKSEFPLPVREMINSASNDDDMAAKEFLRRICIAVRKLLFQLDLNIETSVQEKKSKL